MLLYGYVSTCIICMLCMHIICGKFNPGMFFIYLIHAIYMFRGHTYYWNCFHCNICTYNVNIKVIMHLIVFIYLYHLYHVFNSLDVLDGSQTHRCLTYTASYKPILLVVKVLPNHNTTLKELFKSAQGATVIHTFMFVWYFMCKSLCSVSTTNLSILKHTPVWKCQLKKQHVCSDTNDICAHTAHAHNGTMIHRQRWGIV